MIVKTPEFLSVDLLGLTCSVWSLLASSGGVRNLNRV